MRAKTRTKTRTKKMRTKKRIHASTRWLYAWAMDALHPPPFLGLHACNKMDAWPMDVWAMDALYSPPVFRAPRV